jgi:hypothetical protein
MTTKYTDWLRAYDNGTFNVVDVDITVRLVSDNYIPDESHKPADVEPYIIKGVSVLLDDFFSINGMGAIIETTQAKLQIGLTAFAEVVGEEIDKVITDETRRENLKKAIQNPEGNFWQVLKDNGVKYLVFESVEHGVLTWCEEL